MSRELISLQHITKRFDGQTVLDDLNLTIQENEFVTLLGPSGCGKTTTLRIIGGFESPDTGRVLFDGQDVTALAPNKRPLNTVFQKYALFPHMDIAENIAFGLKISGKSKSYIQDKIKYALKLVNLEGYERRSPDSLSGGQQQRVAIARTRVQQARIVLADEPVASLDPVTSETILTDLKRMNQDDGTTVLISIHSVGFAKKYADRIIGMRRGTVVFDGTPAQLTDDMFRHIYEGDDAGKTGERS